METEYLKNFVVLAKIRNYSEAADSLFISQSSLSKRIMKLENDLGLPLFHRTTKHVELTEHGKVFLKYAEQIVHLEEQGLAELKTTVPTKNQSITIGSIPSMSNYGITDLISDFMKEEHIFVRVKNGQSSSLERMLLNNECDFAFIRQVHDSNRQFIKYKYASDHLVAVVPINHPFAELHSLSLSQLKNEQFILQPENSRPYNFCISLCKQNGFIPNVIYTDSHIENIIDFVSKGIGISLLMKKLVEPLQNNKIKMIDISPFIINEITLCFNKGLVLEEKHKIFLRFFQKAVKNMQLVNEKE